MIDFTNKTALITGASSGIGKAFAETLAAKGANVILVARSKAKLESLAAQIRKEHKVSVGVIVGDLSEASMPDKIFAGVQKLGRQVDVLINNAGFGAHGHFHALPVDKAHGMVMVNVAALVQLTRVFLPKMVEKRDGIIVNVASTAAFQPVPFMAVYGASKAFVEAREYDSLPCVPGPLKRLSLTWRVRARRLGRSAQSKESWKAR